MFHPGEHVRYFWTNGEVVRTDATHVQIRTEHDAHWWIPIGDEHLTRIGQPQPTPARR